MANTLATTARAGRARTMGRFLCGAFPAVAQELATWRQRAQGCPTPELRRMALASLKLKRFHCQGGSVFSVWTTRPYRPRLVRAIVALQSISDYLDNLCDRLGVEDEEAFLGLHEALLTALRPGEELRDYYRLYPYRDDGGYLNALVTTCQQALGGLPSYPLVQSQALELASLYTTLQATKHLGRGVRAGRLVEWLGPLAARQAPPVGWWELAAATGSTLGLFALLALATRNPLEEETARATAGAYFPWIGGLHILLDYLIDQEEDRGSGDLNFVFFYPDQETLSRRLEFFLRRSLAAASALPDPGFHRLVVEGLLALYLSDPKVGAQGLVAMARGLLAAAGPGAGRLWRLCRGLRRLGVV